MLHCIVVGYSTWDKVKTLLSQLTALQGLEHQTHYVDNLGDETVEQEISSLAQCKYYAWGNVGYGPAINAVLKELILDSNDQYLIMNDDVLFRSNCIETMVDAYLGLKKNHKRIGIISPTFVASKPHEDSSRYFKLARVKAKNHTRMLFGPAACWLLDYSFLEKVGGFFPSFFMYGEDLELINRGTSMGYAHYLIHDAFVTHDFKYPPANIKLRVMKEANIMSAHFLNTNRGKQSPHVFALKGLLVSFSRGQFARFKFILLGYFEFIKCYANLKITKSSYKRDEHFRFLT